MLFTTSIFAIFGSEMPISIASNLDQIEFDLEHQLHSEKNKTEEDSDFIHKFIIVKPVSDYRYLHVTMTPNSSVLVRSTKEN